MIRLFVAIPLPPDLARSLAALGGGIQGATWVEAGNLHLTLRFIGEVDEGMACDIDEALAGLRAPAVAIQVAGMGQFGEGDRAPALRRRRADAGAGPSPGAGGGGHRPRRSAA